MIRKKKMGRNIAPLLKKLKARLERDPDIVFSYLFGSYGRGRVSPLSDVDLAFYLREGVDSFEKKLDLAETVSTTLGSDEVDLVIVNDAPAPLVREMVNTGKVFTCKDGDKRIEFEIRKFKEFFDTQHLRGLSERQLIERIKRGQYGSAGSG